MVQGCCVHGCKSNSSQKLGKSFHVVPKVHVARGDNFEFRLSKQRRQKWMHQLKWKNWKPTRFSYVCSDHFLSGKPAKLWDTKNVDWVPTLKLGGDDSGKLTPSQQSRNDRMAQRQEKDNLPIELVEPVIKEEVCDESDEFGTYDYKEEYAQHQLREDAEVQTECCETRVDKESQTYVTGQEEEIMFLKISNDSLRKEIANLRNSLEESRRENATMRSSVQVNSLVLRHEQEKNLLIQNHSQEKLELHRNLAATTLELGTLKKNLETRNVDLDIVARQLHECKELVNKLRWDETAFKSNKEKLKYYTGLHSWEAFEELGSLVAEGVVESPKLSKFTRLLMFLMKLRLNCGDADTAYRFQISLATVSRNFHNVLSVMYNATKQLIPGPPKETATFHTKQKYQILQTVLPITVKSKNGTLEDVTAMIVSVCTVLFNFTPPTPAEK